MPPFLRRPAAPIAPEPPPEPAAALEFEPPVEPGPSSLELELVVEREARLRLAADIANLRRRTAEDLARSHAEGREAALGPLLETADDLRRAADLLPAHLAEEPWVEGIEALARRLDARLAAADLTPVGAEGEPFDPRLHEAVERLAHGAEGTIIAVRRIGYRSGDRLVRPALVAVGGGEPEPATPTDESPSDGSTKE
jgi:molecular chaperone GrpE